MPRSLILSSLVLLATTMAGGSPAFAAEPSSPAVAESLALATRMMGDAATRVDRADFAAAESLAGEALAIRERHLPAGSLDVARARAAWGRAIGERGDYPGALVALRHALEVLQGPPIRDSAEVGTILNSMGRLSNLTGNRADARRMLERALAIRDRVHGPGSLPVRITLNNLAGVTAGSGDLRAARPIYERLVSIEEAQAPLDSARLAINLHNLANVVSDLGELDAGQRLYERALRIRESLYGPNHLRVAVTLSSMASLAEVRRDDAVALGYIDRAIRIMESTMGVGHPYTAEWVVSRASVLSRLGRSEAALADALRGERMSREHLLLTARILSAEDALAYEQFRKSGLHVAMCEVAARSDSAATLQGFDALVRSRSLLLDEMASRRRARAAAGDGVLAELEAAWDEARQRYANLALRGIRGAMGDSSYRSKVETARRAAEASETRLAERSAAFREESRRAGLGAAEVIAALPAGSALVSYVRHATPAVDSSGGVAGPARYLAIVARSGGRLAPVPLGASNRIDSLVTAWRATVAGSADDEAACRRQGERLRAAVWDPLLLALRGATRVFIVPDGALHLVSFGALPATKGYLVESGPLLHLLSTERDLLVPAKAPSPGGQLLVFGGIDFEKAGATGEPALAAEPGAAADAPEGYRGTAPPCDDFRQRRFEFLSGSEREVREVADRWERSAGGRRAVRRLGPEAAESEFKRLAVKSQAIHVATHGFFVEPDCLSDSEEEGVAGNPLLLSGLVLAGANRHSEGAGESDDGFLTAEEIAALDLSGAGWVVLSACGTGTGQLVQGEGVFGLRRAFEIAGAGTLITSLWNVGDAATRRWMEALYEARIGKRLPAAESVRAASRAMIEELRARGSSTHPAAWGGFVACGDWR